MYHRLSDVAGSEIRMKALDALLQNAELSLTELAAAVGCKTSTLKNSLPPLLDSDLISRDKGVYGLTNLGIIQARIIASAASSLVVMDDHSSFWLKHDLSGIPAHLQARIGELAGGEVISDSPDEVLRSQRLYIEAVSQTKEIYGVSPVAAPGYAEMMVSLLEKGARAKLILSRTVIEKLDKAALEKALASGNLELYMLDEIRVAFTLANGSFFMGLYHPDGIYDAASDFVVTSQAAHRWGMDLFNYYLAKATRI